jgi:hypothetical protein
MKILKCEQTDCNNNTKGVCQLDEVEFVYCDVDERLSCNSASFPPAITIPGVNKEAQCSRSNSQKT